MAENSAEKRESFERWVASLKSSDSGSSEPGSSPGSTERPVADPLLAPFDERATTVHRIPKDMIQKLRARESARSVPPDDERKSSTGTTRNSVVTSAAEVSRISRPDIARSLAEVDTDSTAVFVPPPELLLRAKRLNAPPKPSRAPDDPSPSSNGPLDFSAPAPALEPPSLDAFLGSLPPVEAQVEESGTRPVQGALAREGSEPADSDATPDPDSRAAWESIAPPQFRPSRTRLIAWSGVMALVTAGMLMLAYWKLFASH